MAPRTLALLAACAAAACAQVTIYGQTPLHAASSGSATASAAAANYTAQSAFDPKVLTAPALPNPLPPLAYSLWMNADNSTVANLSIPVPGNFFGFSVEFSVVNQVLGKNSSLLQVAFLNLMSNIAERAGSVQVRVGGNTQETASLVLNTSDGRILEKDLTGISNPTQTPPLVFTPDVLYMMGNISKLTNVAWYLGIPFNDTNNLRLQIAEWSEPILGDKLLAFQAGNEPDLYVTHQHRPSTYGPYDYFGEFGVMINAIANNSAIPRKNNLLIGPSVSGTWTPEQVWDTGFIPAHTSGLYGLAVEKYPSDNCFEQFGIGSYVDPQQVFPSYLSHASGQGIVAPYLNSTAIARAAGKPFMMFETNTASCGGFPGLSDSFGAALWAVDYGLQMAFVNFSTALWHVGGQNTYYNPFTPPPTNQSSFHQWTVGAMYYSALAVAEALGSSNTSQVQDTLVNYGNAQTPAYAIYEHGAPARVAAFNYMDDGGNGTATATLSIVLPSAPAQVTVKYMLGLHGVATKAGTGNITWAGQTFGPTFGSDGRPMGTMNITTVPCDGASNTCNITLPAPSFALVFLTDDALKSSGAGASASAATFATSALTGGNTVTIDAAVLATSNGMNGKSRLGGSTSKSTVKSGAAPGARASAVMLITVAFVGALVVIA